MGGLPKAVELFEEAARRAVENNLLKFRCVGGAGGEREGAARGPGVDGWILQSTAPDRVHETMN